jgi:hypothetical protein
LNWNIGNGKKVIRSLKTYTVIKNSQCTWWLQYRKLQVMSKFGPPVSRHLLTRRTVFSVTVFSVARSIFRMYSLMTIFRSSIFLRVFCTVIIRCTETFWLPCTCLCLFCSPEVWYTKLYLSVNNPISSHKTNHHSFVFHPVAYKLYKV